MTGSPTFEELVAEGESVPVDGWDFAWFEGRATEERPSWEYARRLLPNRVAAADAVLDIQTGGGEVFAEVLGQIPHRPAMVAATEGWPPNLALARRNLVRFGGSVAEAADRADLPFDDGSFDLVVSRHPTVTVWDEIARVLRPGGAYLSQQIGPGSVHELRDFLMGPQPASDSRSPQRARSAAAAAGLDVVDLRYEALRMAFYDIGTVVAFLRKVIWIVPDFTVDRYRDRLAALHQHITTAGSFIAYSQRFLIETRAH